MTEALTNLFISVNQAESDHEKIQQLYMTPQLHPKVMYTTNNFEDEDDDNDGVYDFFMWIKLCSDARATSTFLPTIFWTGVIMNKDIRC